MSAIAELLALGSAPISPQDFGVANATYPALRAFESVLGHKNGFYAFDGALLFRPDSLSEPELGIVQWNDAALWRDPFAGIDGLVFFADDVFGHPFAMGQDDAIFTFDPETEYVERIADDLEAWAAWILQEPAVTLGAGIAGQWQRRFGPIPAGTRLLPATPFMLGGTYELTNFRPIVAVEAMQYRADIATQLRGVPDGTQVILKVVD